MKGITIDYIKKFQTIIAVVLSLLGVWAYINLWWSENVISKEQHDISINTVLLTLNDMQLRDFQKQGIDSLSDEDEYEYQQLVKQGDRLRCKRNRLLGIPSEC